MRKTFLKQACNIQSPFIVGYGMLYAADWLKHRILFFTGLSGSDKS